MTEQRPGPWAKVRLCFKRAATFVYGPAELPEEEDPIVFLDRQLGLDPRPDADAHPTERQRSYDRLPPRGD